MDGNRKENDTSFDNIKNKSEQNKACFLFLVGAKYYIIYHPAQYFSSWRIYAIKEYLQENSMSFERKESQDFGGKACLIDIRNEALSNENFRKVIWTGEHLQVTVMSIPAGGEIGLEMHDDVDQLVKVEGGCANVYMGACKHQVKCMGKINANYAVLIPAGTWHNIINACSCPLKVYSVYAPPKHSQGTIHKSKLDSDLAEE